MTQTSEDTRFTTETRIAADPGAHRLTAALARRAREGSRPGERTDGFRIVLAIEGGGMRGAVTAGMALALEESGMLPLFDAVYGASAGAICAAWLLSSRPQGLRGMTDPSFAKAMIRKRNLLRGRPLVNVTDLVEIVYREVFPLDFASILANPIELHMLATDVITGASIDLREDVADEASLRLAIRASCALPLLAGGPVSLGGRHYFDAGLAESIPYHQALRDGATHVLVLRSRRSVDQGHLGPRPPRSSRFVARVGLRRHTPQLLYAYMQRPLRLTADDHDLAVLSAAESGPAVHSLRPHDSTPHVGRLESDGALLSAAFEAGCEAVRDWKLATGMPSGR